MDLSSLFFNYYQLVEDIFFKLLKSLGSFFTVLIKLVVNWYGFPPKPPFPPTLITIIRTYIHESQVIVPHNFH